MKSILVNPSGLRIPVASEETVLETLWRAGIELEGPCGGEGTCGKCQVRVEPVGEAPETPHPRLTPEESQRGWRLACLLVPSGDLTVHLPFGGRRDSHVPEVGGTFAMAPRAPAARVVWRDGRAWLEYEGEASVILPEWPNGETPKGLAVDLGTTTLVVSLLDLATGRRLATASGINPQVRFGHDVLTRIRRGATSAGLGELTAAVREGLNRLIQEACRRGEADPQEVVDAVVGANTTMLQLAAGIDPAPLGRSPFRVGIEAGRTHPASRFGLKLHPAGRVYVPPVAHAFVGSDVSAGLLASRFFEREGSILFVDIGTNGELALAAPGRLLVTSAAAGPALEGMGISCGMRADPGAVEAIEADDGGLTVQVVGGGAARGICGSGLIDAVACLRRLGILDASGRMRGPRELSPLAPWIEERLGQWGGQPVFRLADEVSLTQHDVRQVQLAKGAIRTAIDLLLSEAGVRPDDLDEVILAGAFGCHLQPESLQTIGLFPVEVAERVVLAGNTSRDGAEVLLLDRETRVDLKAWMGQVRHLGLAQSPRFRDTFVRNLRFPD